LREEPASVPLAVRSGPVDGRVRALAVATRSIASDAAVRMSVKI